MRIESVDFDDLTADLAPAAAEIGRMWFNSTDGEHKFVKSATAVENIRDAQKVRGVPVDNAAIADKRVLRYSASDNKLKYVSVASAVADSEGGFTLSFFTSNSDYIEIAQDGYKVVASFEFQGTGILTPSIFRIIASRDGLAGSGSVRLYDFTNALQIAVISVTGDTKTFYSTTSFSNLPANRTIFEVQVKKDAVGDSKMRLHSMKIL